MTMLKPLPRSYSAARCSLIARGPCLGAQKLGPLPRHFVFAAEMVQHPALKQGLAGFTQPLFNCDLGRMRDASIHKNWGGYSN